MTDLIYGADQDISDWVSIGLFGRPGKFDKFVAVGVKFQDKLIAGIVYNNMMTDNDNIPYSIDMSIYSIDKRWCSKHNLKALFSIPFTQYQLRRVSTLCSANEGEIIMFNERLGFIQEGKHPAYWPDGGTAISFGMLKSQCRWI
jgi:hypothetical protein